MVRDEEPHQKARRYQAHKTRIADTFKNAESVGDRAMILLQILTVLMIAVELPVTLLYHREEDVYVLTASVFALLIEAVYMRCI